MQQRNRPTAISYLISAFASRNNHQCQLSLTSQIDMISKR